LRYTIHTPTLLLFTHRLNSDQKTMALHAKRGIVKIFITLIVTLLYCSQAWALRCGSELVSKGDRKIEVLKACSEPFLVDNWEEENVAFQGDEATVVGEKTIHSIEVWTYNFGPTRFMQFLRFKNGKLDNISTGPYGFNKSALTTKSDPDCRKPVSDGNRKIEVLTNCGEPTTKDTWQVERIIKHKDKGLVTGRKVYIATEEWTYNFGPNRFMLFITLENGIVVNIETGDHGF